MKNIKYADNRKVFNWHEEGIPFVSFDMLDSLGVPNMYTTRYKSSDGEKGLRVAVMKGEDIGKARSIVRDNLSKLVMQLGSDINHLRVTNQQHTANVIEVDEQKLGYGASVANTNPVDGIITDVTGACLVVYGADCPSVYIVDPIHHAIGLVHAGWKGTLGKIPEVAIRMMADRYGSNPEEMYAAIGPSICENCYEMGDEIFDMFATQWSLTDANQLLHRHSSGKYHLDLWKANTMTLERAGLLAEHIAVTNICTCCNTDTFYSYRAHKMENEQAALLVNSFNE